MACYNMFCCTSTTYSELRQEIAGRDIYCCPTRLGGTNDLERMDGDGDRSKLESMAFTSMAQECDNERRRPGRASKKKTSELTTSRVEKGHESEAVIEMAVRAFVIGNLFSALPFQPPPKVLLRRVDHALIGGWATLTGSPKLLSGASRDGTAK